MIIQITGKVLKFSKQDKYSFVDISTDSGVGYRILVPARYEIECGVDITIYTSFQVREDSQMLYGFNTEVERDFFELLLSVSGIGPKIGLAILSKYTPSEVASCILEKDVETISATPGLGKKGAGKIVVELENKVDVFGFDLNETVAGRDGMEKELKSVLKTLGFTGKSLDEYLEKGRGKMKEVSSIDELVKLVLHED